MRRIKWVGIAIILIVVAAFATRPGPAEFDAMLRGALLDRIAREDVGSDDDVGKAVALIACKLRPSDCFDVMRAALDVTFDERLLITRATVTGAIEAKCTGAFGRFWCSRDLGQP